MRILMLHNAYQIRGGEDVVVDLETQLLTKKGHDVRLWKVTNDDIRGFADRARVAIRTTYNAAARDELGRLLKSFRPDVVQVHNFFPLLSPAVYDACRAAGVPVVQTLHNFRILCAGGSFFRDGLVCEQCLHGSPYQAVVHRCYRGSAIGSLSVARMIATHKARGTWRQSVDLFFALSEFAKDKFVEGSLPAEKIVVKANFANPPAPAPGAGDVGDRGKYALYVGRLSEEKGVRNLMQAWKQVTFPLRVLGGGPLLEELRALAPPSVVFYGAVGSQDIATHMRDAAFLLVPSLWYEGFPMVVAEAYASGLPVIASRVGSLAEIVVDNETGRLVPMGDVQALADAASAAFRDPAALERWGSTARRHYETRYNADAVYATLIGEYERLARRPQAATGAQAR